MRCLRGLLLGAMMPGSVFLSRESIVLHVVAERNRCRAAGNRGRAEVIVSTDFIVSTDLREQRNRFGLG